MVNKRVMLVVDLGENYLKVVNSTIVKNIVNFLRILLSFLFFEKCYIHNIFHNKS